MLVIEDETPIARLQAKFSKAGDHIHALLRRGYRVYDDQSMAKQ
jgi:hypothetical protein